MRTIEIVNLKCGGCVNTVKKGLYSIPGVIQVEVDLEKSRVMVAADDELTWNRVIEKLSKMGYPEVGQSNTVLHKAKSFVSCVSGKMSVE